MNLKSPQVLTALVLIASSLAFAQVDSTPVTAPTPAEERDLTDMIRSLFSSDEAEEAEPAGMESHADALLAASDLLSAEELKGAQAWRAPEYTNQAGALGWDEKVFDVPEALRARVNFWRDIYTKYTTDQGVIHDNLHIDIVYGNVDFSEIMKDPTRNIFWKAKARENLVKTRKAEYSERLLRLSLRKNSEGLGGEDLRIWRAFERINDPDKFKEAASKTRIRFQLGQRDKFILGIYHSGRYMKEMERIFRDEGMPIELTRLPFVESSFNLRARSRVGASGIWQFMRRTAKPFMKVNNDIDERNDPLKSTRASARLLKQNYSMLQAWPFAVTGYNHGPFGVKTIVNKVGTRDLAEIIGRYSSKRFGFASENFYACFLAALDAEKNARKYFGEVKWGPELQVAEIKLRKPLGYQTVLQFFDNDAMQAELANSHLNSNVRKGKAKIPAGSFFRVPPLRQIIAEDFIAGRMDAKKLAAALKDNPMMKLETLPQEEPAEQSPALGIGPAPASVTAPAPAYTSPMPSPVPRR